MFKNTHVWKALQVCLMFNVCRDYTVVVIPQISTVLKDGECMECWNVYNQFAYTMYKMHAEFLVALNAI